MAEDFPKGSSITNQTCKETCTSDQTSSSSSKVFCKIGKGWSCVITKTEGPDAGKVFYKCGEGCTCQSGSPSSTCIITQDYSGSEAFCQCGEGWSCVISKTAEGPEASKAFAECNDGGCVIVSN